MAENTEKKTLYTSAALEELFGEQLKVEPLQEVLQNRIQGRA